jgi:hypothetical protein
VLFQLQDLTFVTIPRCKTSTPYKNIQKSATNKALYSKLSTSPCN